jgi:hypothetical protein
MFCSNCLASWICLSFTVTMIFSWKVTKIGSSFYPVKVSLWIRLLCITLIKGLAHPRSKQIWQPVSKHRVDTCLCLLSHFQFLSYSFLPSVFFHLLPFYLHCMRVLGSHTVKLNCDSTLGTIGVPHFVFYKILRVQLQLHILTTQALFVFYELKFNCSCTSFNYSRSVV